MYTANRASARRWAVDSRRATRASAMVGIAVCGAICSCAGSQTAKRPPSQVPKRVRALGVATAQDADLARRIAQSRALKGLAGLLEPNAVRFEYVASQGDSSLKIEIGPREIEHTQTKFNKIKTSWISLATAKRSPASLAAMRALDRVAAQAQVRHPDPAISLLRANNRALRNAIEAACNLEEGSVFLSGSMTLIDVREDLSATGARVELEAHVRLDARRKPTPDETRAVHAEAVKEYRGLLQWNRAAAALERLIALSPPDTARYAELGHLYLSAGEPGRAADAFAKARQLNPADLEHLRWELKAAKQMGDEDRVRSVHQRLRQAEGS